MSAHNTFCVNIKIWQVLFYIVKGKLNKRFIFSQLDVWGGESGSTGQKKPDEIIWPLRGGEAPGMRPEPDANTSNTTEKVAWKKIFLRTNIEQQRINFVY